MKHWIFYLFFTLLYSGCAVKKQFNSTNKEFRKLNKLVHGEKILNYQNSLKEFNTNKDFKCQEPIYNRYFQNKLNTKISSCSKEIPFFKIDKKKGGEITWINPNDISQIHILFAGEGDSLMSNFGHIMYRFIICPKGIKNQQECDENIYQHLVLGYMGNIDDYTIDYIKGLTGQYKSYLFASSFMDTYKTYAITEFRNLYSIPIKLDRGEINQFARELAQIHWSYKGKYKFFTNNCASLLQNSLTLLSPKVSMKESYIRPDSLFKALKENAFVDELKLKDLKAAERNGYYFPSTLPYYKKALSVVNKHMSKLHFKTLNDYMQITAKTRMFNIENDVSYAKLLKNNLYVLEANQLLEELTLLKLDKLILAEISKVFLNFDSTKLMTNPIFTGEEKEIFQRCIMDSIQKKSTPFQTKNKIPNKDDNDINHLTIKSCKNEFGVLRPILQKIKNTSSNANTWGKLDMLIFDMEQTLSNILKLRKIQTLGLK